MTSNTQHINGQGSLNGAQSTATLVWHLLVLSSSPYMYLTELYLTDLTDVVINDKQGSRNFWSG